MDELASEFDTAWKEALEWFIEPFFAFLFSSIHSHIDWSRGYQFLDKELQEVVPEAVTGRGTVDKLVKVWTPAGEEAWVLIHIEVQSQHDPNFAERMYVYNHRLRDKYGRMPVSLAVLGDESKSWRPDHHREGQWGCDVHFTYPIAKLLDYKGQDELLEVNANPFAAVTLAHLKAQETKDDPVNRYNWKVRLAKGLFNRGLTNVQVRRLLNVIDWVIKLSKAQKALFEEEMIRLEKEKAVERLGPTLQHFRDEGIATGLQRAIQKALNRRFGQPGVDLMPRVKAIDDLTALENLIDTIETTDLDAIRNMLPPAPQV